MFHASPVPVVISAIPSGVILDINDGALKLIGLRRDTIIGKSGQELSLWGDAADRERFGEQFRKSARVSHFPARMARVGSDARRRDVRRDDRGARPDLRADRDQRRDRAAALRGALPAHRRVVDAGRAHGQLRRPGLVRERARGDDAAHAGRRAARARLPRFRPSPAAQGDDGLQGAPRGRADRDLRPFARVPRRDADHRRGHRGAVARQRRHHGSRAAAAHRCHRATPGGGTARPARRDRRVVS